MRAPHVARLYRPLLKTCAPALLSIVLCVSACGGHSSPKPTQRSDSWSGRGRECVRAFLGRESAYAELGEAEQRDPILDTIPIEARRTILAAGLSRLASNVLHEAGTPSALSLTLLAHRQDLNMRLISLETQLSAMVFEAECTGELIEAMIFELADKSDVRSLKFAVGSLVVGAAAATGSGAWDLAGSESKGPAVVALTGGLLSAALGAAAFVPRDERLHFNHAHNLLTPILRAEDPEQLFPLFVFRLLTSPGSNGAPSPRETLLKKWRALIDDHVPQAERAAVEEILYGAGGTYDQNLLSLRERMYDALETELNALARDLELLDRFFVRVIADQRQPKP